MLMLNFVWNDSWIANTKAEISPVNNSQLLQNLSEELPADKLDGEAAQHVQYYIVSRTANDVFKTASQTLRLTKKPYLSITSLDMLPERIPSELVGIIICEGNYDNIGSMEKLFQYSSAGKDVVFAAMPDTSSANFKKYYERLGIERFGSMYEHEGVDFLESLIVSGMYINADVNVKCNEIKLNGKSRFYAVGHDKDESVKYHDRNPLIWRTFYDNGMIFVINGDFLSDFSFTGILTGILGMNKDVYYYPVINAGLFSIDALPYYGDENSENVLKAYNRDIVQFQRDIMWSDLMSIVKRLNVKMTFFPYIGNGQDAIESKLISYFGKEIIVNGCEWGYYPSRYIDKFFPEYKMQTELHHGTADSTSRMSFNKQDFGYYNNSSVSLPIISNGYDLTRGEVYKAFSVASGLGYISHYVDMKEILQNPEPSDKWTQFKLDFVNSVYPITKTYEHFSFSTATDVAKKVSVYLNCDPDVRVGVDNITVHPQTVGTVSYIVRTNRIITWTEGCEFKPLYGSYYLVTVTDTAGILHTRDRDGDPK